LSPNELPFAGVKGVLRGHLHLRRLDKTHVYVMGLGEDEIHTDKPFGVAVALLGPDGWSAMLTKG